jgi:DNA-binding response OmpR family regulator
MRILIVEDEAGMAEGLRFNFEQEGYEVVVVGDGRSALKIFQDGDAPVDLVILDLMLPGMSGYETCREIRRIDDHVPVLVLSARTLSEDRAQAFDCGTDQYMSKPFALPELLSRVRNLLERRRPVRVPIAPTDAPETAAEFEFGNVHVDFRKFEIRRGRQVQSLTTKEMELLRYFVEYEGSVLSRSQILEDVWGETSDVTTRTIDNFVMRLRKFVEENPSQPRHILSVRGTGYRFIADPESAPLEELSS